MSSFKNAIVLTGSIGTGKSTTANILKLLGYRIIDADQVSKAIFAEESDEIVKIFGTLDREEIADQIFSDQKKKQELESLLHPLIREKILSDAKKLEALSVPYFVDIPLFFESGDAYPMDKVVVVYAPKELQQKRLVEGRAMSFDQAKKRIDSQIDIEAKKKKATWVIDNSGDIKHLTREVERFVENLSKCHSL